MDSDLHITYAPILHFSQAERFFPASAEALLTRAALYRRGETQPLAAPGRVRPEHLRQMADQDTFLRLTEAAPLTGEALAASWSRDMLALLLAAARNPVADAYDAGRAQRLYRWYAPHTRAATSLFWWNWLLMAPTVSLRRRGVALELPRFPLPQAARDQAQATWGGKGAYTYYYHLSRQGDYQVLQYWFLYAYSDWATSFDGLADHEGGWEGVQLFFKAQGEQALEPPTHIAYLNHGSRIVKPWGHADVAVSDTHPHVFVAAGSHACYPERKRYELLRLYGLHDDARGEGLTVRPQQWQQGVALGATPWLCDYQGAWGTRYWLTLETLRELAGAQPLPGDAALPQELLLPGVSAPGGPRYQAVGSERDAWARPPALAGLATTSAVADQAAEPGLSA